MIANCGEPGGQPGASKSQNSGGSVGFQYQVSRVIHLPGWGAYTLIFKNTNTRKLPKPFLVEVGSMTEIVCWEDLDRILRESAGV